MKRRIISRASVLEASRGLMSNKRIDDYDLPEDIKLAIEHSRYSRAEINANYRMVKRELEATED